MGEFIPRPADAPQDSKGATADTGKYLQAVALAAQLGKSVEEVLAFMGTASQQNLPVVASSNKEVSVSKEAIIKNVEQEPEDKAISSTKEHESEDGFVVTEEVSPEDATEAELDKIAADEDENSWDEHIRIGSKVKIVYMPKASRINWVGKVGKVTRVIGNEAAKVYEVEFAGRKIQRLRLNKKTGKLERGYEVKKLSNTFSDDQVELHN